MKSTITWAILADARSARICENSGPNKGFAVVPDGHLTAQEPSDYADAPGLAHSSHGPGRAGMTRRDPKSMAANAFARQIADELGQRHAAGAFDRLILVAAPQMMGELREALNGPVQASILAEVNKDLTDVALPDLPKHLAHVLAA